MNAQSQEKILRRKEVESITGLARSTIYAMIKTGAFPEPVQLGNGHAVGWVASEVSTWIQEKMSVRNSNKKEK